MDPHTREVRPDEHDLKRIRFLLSNKDIPKAGHNVKHDVLHMDIGMGIPVLGDIYDTMHMAHIIGEKEEDEKESLGLKLLAEKHDLMPADDEVFLQKTVVAARRVGKRLGWYLADDLRADYWMPSAVWKHDPMLAINYGIKKNVNKDYCINDSIRTMLLLQLYLRWIEEQKLTKVLDFERELWPITYQIETRGVRVDKEYIQKLVAESGARMREIEASLGGINTQSPKQLQTLFFDRLKLQVLSWTSGGKKGKPQPQLNAENLEVYAAEGCAEAKLVMEHRLNAKLSGTYFGNYLDKSIPERREMILNRKRIKRTEWIIHFTLKQLDPITGRYSCANPNMQNVPKDKEEDEDNPLYAARIPFGPRKGYRWYCYDFQQIEARIFASIANEETMLAAFRAGRDVYQELADTVSKQWGIVITRGAAKAIFLGKLYGLGVAKIAVKLKMKLVDTQKLVKAFNATFPKIKKFMRETIHEVSKEAYAFTVLGRRIPIVRKQYRGVNYICQGSAADLIKLAMINISRYLKQNLELDCHIVLQVHDELVFEIAEKDCTHTLLNTLGSIMSDNHGLFQLATPVDCSRVLRSWAEKTEVPLCLAA